MHTRPSILSVSAAVLWLVLHTSQAHATPADPKNRREIEQLIHAYERALADAQVPAIMSLYGSEPVFMPEFAPAAVGRDAVQQAYRWVFDTLKLNGRFHIHEVDVTGELAWARTSSTGSFMVRATGVEGEVGNNEFFLFRREGGAWKIHRYMFNANKPLSR